MKKLFILFLICSASQVFGLNLNNQQQGNLFLELKQLPDDSWGVFVSTDNIVEESDQVRTGSGQVTLVAPLDFSYFDFENHSGTWVENARVISPEEALENTYISFGFVMDVPQIQLSSGEETLLFSFRTENEYVGSFYLFENGLDPFETPNSYGSNPGNDLGMIVRNDDRELTFFFYKHNIMSEENHQQFSKNGNFRASSLLVSELEENDEE